MTTDAAGTLQRQDTDNADRIRAVKANPASHDIKLDGGSGYDLPPKDPKEFHDWWQSLSPADKDRVYAHDHDIGNHPGMPWDPPDHRGKDYYNRLHLPELE